MVSVSVTVLAAFGEYEMRGPARRQPVRARRVPLTVDAALSKNTASPPPSASVISAGIKAADVFGTVPAAAVSVDTLPVNGVVVAITTALTGVGR